MFLMAATMSMSLMELAATMSASILASSILILLKVKTDMSAKLNAADLPQLPQSVGTVVLKLARNVMMAIKNPEMDVERDAN